MLVKEIIPLDKRRCKVLLEEGFAFALYKGEIKRYDIQEGAELPLETYERILSEVLNKRARERVMHILKSSDKTELELRRKLQEGYYPEGCVDQAITFLKNYGYVNDASYAERYIESYRDKKSQRQISYDLSQKGIDREVIKVLLEENPINELSQAKALLVKKHYEPENSSPEEKRRIAAFLGRKGFSYSVIGKVMEDFFEID